MEIFKTLKGKTMYVMPEKTSFEGIYWCNSAMSFRAEIAVNDELRHLGYFYNIDEARIALYNYGRDEKDKIK